MAGMERRQSPRLAVAIKTTLTVLGEADVNVAAEVQNLSGNGAKVLIDRKLPTGACVKLVLEDCLYLGEVAYCRQVDGGFQAGLVLEHAVHALNDLHWLMQSLLAESVSSTRGFESRPEPKSKARR
ncbi:PilZ domain-containing protein [Paludibaculum fermentans]|uniref:PilZ domain-containing protein n=1 Tax=Paludibaculum fermentans TaxID=1473598 RepID=A0A7S7SMF8_PALFE|nr:PilZ domain-containing protein [Paludibaculum fermentans]QOY90399.1 PilZ domain-containing protein [Paludibaculum fermentans]